MTTPSVPSPDPAPEIDLDGRDGEPGAAAPSRRLPPIGNAALAFAAVALLLAASVVAVVKLLGEPRTDAERLVSSFLAAALRGDAGKALSMTDHYAGIPLVRGEALDDRWSVVEVAQVAYEEGRRAEVYVEIETDDGVRIGERFVVDFSKGEPKLSNALKRVEWYTSFNRPVINGADVAVREGGNEQTYFLLPGRYEFSERAPRTVALESVEAVALGSTLVVAGEEASRSYVVTDRMSLTESGREALAEAVHGHFDGCVDLLNGGASAPQCAVGPTDAVRQELNATQGSPRNADAFDGAVWEVTAYPDVAVSQGYWGLPGVPLVTVEPGTARVGLASGEELECLLWVDGLSARFEDGVAVAVEWQPFASASVSAKPGCSSFTAVR